MKGKRRKMVLLQVKRRHAKMIRARLVWFGVGFSSTGATIAHLIWKDLIVDRSALSSDVKQKFAGLESRMVKLEHSYHNRNPAAQADD